jgi:hypothetical protein
MAARLLPPGDDVPDDTPEIPDFDALDMLLGFGIAAAAAAQQYPAVVLLIGGFVAQKAVRQNPAMREQVGEWRKQLPPPGQLLRRLPGRRQKAATTAAADMAVAALAPASDDPLLLQLEEAPHLLVIGHTRGGKTTLIHELAQRRVRAKERVVVCDPDAAPGTWPGCKVYGGGDRFDEIAEALTIADGVVRKRRQERRNGRRDFPPMHFVLDEVQDTIAEIPASLELIEAIARRGAKLNLHVLLGVQDKQVKTLGLEGKSHLLNNLLTVDVYRDRATGQRLARLDSVGTKMVLPIPQLPDPEQLVTAKQTDSAAVTPSRALVTPTTTTPQGATTAAVSAEPILAALLATPCDPVATDVRPHGGATESRPDRDPSATPDTAAESPQMLIAAAEATPGVHVVFAETGAVVAGSLTLVLPKDGSEIDRDGRIKALVALRVSGRKIREIVGGNAGEVRTKVRQFKLELGLTAEGSPEDEE